jgi:hypothetical protein
LIGGRQIIKELEIPTVRRRKVEVGVHNTASSEGRPLIVSLVVSFVYVLEGGADEIGSFDFSRDFRISGGISRS